MLRSHLCCVSVINQEPDHKINVHAGDSVNKLTSKLALMRITLLILKHGVNYFMMIYLDDYQILLHDHDYLRKYTRDFKIISHTHTHTLPYI